MEYILLKDLFSIKKGKKVEQIEEQTDDAIRYIQIDDLRNNDNIKYCINNNYVLASLNDIIIAWDGANAGTIGYGIEGAIGSTLAVLNIKNDKFNSEFCGMFLKSKFNYLREKCTGATIPHISKSALESLEIPMINLKAQQKIVNLLKCSQNIINKKREQIKMLDELVKSQFIEMFGDPVTNPKSWQKVKCNQITIKIGSGSTPKGGNSSYKDEGISLIRSMNVHMGRFETKDLAFIDEEQADKLRNVVIEDDDVLLNITGASVARCCVVPVKILPARVNQHVSIVRCNKDMIKPIFLCNQFICESYQSVLWDIATSGGATREAITKQQIENLEIICPPIELQNQFADFVKVIDKLKVEAEKSLKEMEDNFNSLMQRAFKGELFN